MRRAALILAALALTGCFEPPEIPTAADALKARLALVDVEHEACLRYASSDADKATCDGIARDRVAEESAIVWAAAYPLPEGR